MQFPGIKMHRMKIILLIIALFTTGCGDPVHPNTQVWVEPSIFQDPDESVKVFVWFNNQFLTESTSYKNRQPEFTSWKRSDLRKHVMTRLKEMRDESMGKASEEIFKLEANGVINDVVPHWIINGFSCTLKKDSIHLLKEVPGVSRIFYHKFGTGSQNPEIGPRFIRSPNPLNLRTDIPATWNIQKINAVKVWKELQITGKGVLNVVHDFGFKLDVPPIESSLYTNTLEIPGNGLDDDSNGFIDDYHGFDFDANSNEINRTMIVQGTFIHGNACAAIIAGGPVNNAINIGMAPDSKWAPVVGIRNFEAAIEWAIEQNAHTYSMSFSLPNLGEYRSHWRKVIEQATYCGIVFISGAGNFASGPAMAQIPEQMRIPEDIPDAVFGVAGVGEDLRRPPFSSQGPVKWENSYYRDGFVDKPDFTTYNSNLPFLAVDGTVKSPTNGNSFAGPHLAGTVALMLSANPELLPWEIKEILVKTSHDILNPGFDMQSGYGLVDAYSAVNMSLNYKK